MPPVKATVWSGAELVTVILPEPVTGEPDTDIPVPAEIPTLVTVPLPVPAPIKLLTSAPVIPVFKLGVEPFDKIAGTPVSGELLVTVILPELVTGEPETDIPVPAVMPTLVTVPVFVVADVFIVTVFPERTVVILVPPAISTVSASSIVAVPPLSAVSFQVDIVPPLLGELFVIV